MGSPTSQKQKQFDYFATPDGEEVTDKLMHVLKPTIPTAVFLGLCDVLLVSHPKGIVNTAFRYALVSVPIVGIASTFVLATNTIGSLRKKDDHLNWFLGGFITGSTAGFIKRSGMLGFNMGMFVGILAVIRKEMGYKGYTVFPSEFKKSLGGTTMCLMNYSLYEERPRNWTTGPTKQ